MLEVLLRKTVSTAMLVTSALVQARLRCSLVSIRSSWISDILFFQRVILSHIRSISSVLNPICCR